MKAGNVLTVIGLAVFAVGTCMLDSENPAGLSLPGCHSVDFGSCGLATL